MKNAFANILGQQGMAPMGQMPPVMMQQPMQPQQVQTDMFGQQQGGLRQALMMGLMGGQYGRT